MSTAENAARPFTPASYLTCIAGPDRGKRLAVSMDSLLLGRDVACNMLSDDPDVAPRAAVLTLEGDLLRVCALEATRFFVDGQPVAEAMLRSGQQLRLGRSLWSFGPSSAAQGVRGFVGRIGDQLSGVAGIERPQDFDARDMFADVTKRRSDDEMEAHFTVGTSSTTPPLAEVDAQWPRPWVFARVFALTMALYIGFVAAWNEFGNLYLIPSLIMIGSVAVPFSLLIFFFETNVARNISLYQVIRLLLIGGLLSIVLSLLGFRWTRLDTWLGAAGAGIIEEIGKGLALLLVVARPRYRWTLNGLLLGATVGTGFAIFESAGYALAAALENGAAAMRGVITQRGILSVLGGHVLWTGLVGAALWRVRGDQPFRREMLADPRFLRVLAVCIAMHMIWNAPLVLPFYSKYIALGFVAWLLVLGFIQDGLRQIRHAQARANE